MEIASTGGTSNLTGLVKKKVDHAVNINLLFKNNVNSYIIWKIFYSEKECVGLNLMDSIISHFTIVLLSLDSGLVGFHGNYGHVL